MAFSGKEIICFCCVSGPQAFHKTIAIRAEQKKKRERLNWLSTLLSSLELFGHPNYRNIFKAYFLCYTDIYIFNICFKPNQSTVFCASDSAVCCSSIVKQIKKSNKEAKKKKTKQKAVHFFFLSTPFFLRHHQISASFCCSCCWQISL